MLNIICAIFYKLKTFGEPVFLEVPIGTIAVSPGFQYRFVCAFTLDQTIKFWNHLVLSLLCKIRSFGMYESEATVA